MCNTHQDRIFLLSPFLAADTPLGRSNFKMPQVVVFPESLGFTGTSLSWPWYSPLSPVLTLLPCSSWPPAWEPFLRCRHQAPWFTHTPWLSFSSIPLSPCMPWWPHLDQLMSFYSWRETSGSPFPWHSPSCLAVPLGAPSSFLSSHTLPSKNSFLFQASLFRLEVSS